MHLKDLNPIIAEDIDSILAADIDWKRFKNKTILISGANGFLPSYLVYLFLSLNEKNKLNCKVIGISRNRKKARQRFGSLLKRKDLSIIYTDVSGPLEVKRKINFIIHAASQASPKYFGTDPVGTINANTLGTNNLLTLAKKNKVESFLFISSGEVYGSVASENVPTREDQYGYIDIDNVRSCYAESKRLGETMCVSWFKQHKVAAKIVRPFHTYGPGMDLKDGRVYADFVSDIVNGRNIKMKSEGRASRAFCYLKDATEGFIRVLLEGENGEAYNVGNPQAEISIAELSQKLVSLFPEKKLEVQKGDQSTKGYIQSTIDRNSPDITKIKTLGWFPATSIEEGFKRTIESYTLC